MEKKLRIALIFDVGARTIGKKLTFPEIITFRLLFHFCLEHSVYIKSDIKKYLTVENRFENL